jgi:hypothetical protein
MGENLNVQSPQKWKKQLLSAYITHLMAKDSLVPNLSDMTLLLPWNKIIDITWKVSMYKHMLWLKLTPPASEDVII